jgi:hypothetical protein
MYGVSVKEQEEEEKSCAESVTVWSEECHCLVETTRLVASALRVISQSRLIGAMLF